MNITTEAAIRAVLAADGSFDDSTVETAVKIMRGVDTGTGTGDEKPNKSFALPKLSGSLASPGGR